MNAVTLLSLGLAAVFAVLGTAKVLAVPSMRARAAHVGFSADAYRLIGLLEVLAAAGLLVGIAVPFIGALAGDGLLLLLIGAVAAHLRNRDGLREAAPAVVLGLVSIGYLALSVGAI